LRASLGPTHLEHVWECGCDYFSKYFLCWNASKWYFFYFLKIIFEIDASKRFKTHKKNKFLKNTISTAFPNILFGSDKPFGFLYLSFEFFGLLFYLYFFIFQFNFLIWYFYFLWIYNLFLFYFILLFDINLYIYIYGSYECSIFIKRSKFRSFSVFLRPTASSLFQKLTILLRGPKVRVSNKSTEVKHWNLIKTTSFHQTHTRQGFFFWECSLFILNRVTLFSLSFFSFIFSKQIYSQKEKNFLLSTYHNFLFIL